MKKIVALMLLCSMSTASLKSGFMSEFMEVVDGAIKYANVPINALLNIQSIPGLKEVLHEEEGTYKKYARYPKLAISLFLAYKTWKTETGQKVVEKVSGPVKRALGMKTQSTTAKKKH